MKRVVLDGLPLAVRSAGVATYARELSSALAAAAPETTFVLLCPRLPWRSLAAPSPRPHNLEIAVSSLYPLALGSFAARLPRSCSLESIAGPCDLFHGTSFDLPRRHAAPAVVTVHDLALLRFPELGTTALRRMVERSCTAVRRANAVIAVSAATCRDVVELCGVEANRVHVVYNGVAPAFQPLPAATARARAAARIGSDQPYILHVGTLEPRKNLPTLLRAFAALEGDPARPPRLVLAGRRGWGDAPIFAAVDELGLRDSVTFLGDVDPSDLPPLYAAATALVYPSLYEGFGLPVLEAMACGAPVIASESSALPEIVGEAGLLVDGGDVDAVREAIRRVASDEALRSELRARGLQRARRFSWQRAARETLAVYRSVLAGR
jgi:glycosyltransferase involved in cell wall biosynthesis